MSNRIGKPNKEQIEQRAYEIYLERGAQEGQDLANWLAAEIELTQAIEQSAAAPASAARSSKREAAA